MNPIRRAGTLLVLLLFFINSLRSANAPEFVFTPSCIEASRLISCLKLKSARNLLDQERAAKPNNYAIDYLENYIDFYTLITDQDVNKLHELEVNKARRLHKFAQLPAQSPYRLYAQAEINLQWAFSRVFYEEYLDAAFEFRDAYKALNRNKELFPFFLPNYKNIGLLNALLGSVPDNYKWLLNLVGMKGNFEEGMNLLENFVDHQSYTPDQLLDKQTAIYYYTFLEFNIGSKEVSWTFCERLTRDYSTNLMSCYLRTFIASHTGHNEQALEVFAKQPTGQDYSAFPILDHVHGVAFMNKLDTSAIIWFKRYVSLSKGQNLIKDAYKRIAWMYLLARDHAKFELYRGMIQKYGAAIGEEDKAALKESLLKAEPHLVLLKARLLFDGGYYEKALAILVTAQVIAEKDKIEYEYRFGRILGEMKQYQKAIEHYKNCIKLSGPETKLHYAPFSCNQLGSIYLKLGDSNNARFYYKKALEYKGYDYRGSVTSVAKTALNRIKG